MITIPSLSSTNDINDTDLIMVTTSEGTSYKMSGLELNKRNKVCITDDKNLTGAPLKTGNVVRVYFTADITANDTLTALSLNYNSVPYPVKIPKDGALANYYAFDLGNSTYKYLQAYTTLEFIFDGTNFVLIGNPVVISGNGTTLFANMSLSKGDVGLGNVANKDLSNVVNTGDSATPVSGGTTKFTSGGAFTEFAKKIDWTSLDATPTQNSDNPVKSGGVYTALDGKVDKTSVVDTVASGNMDSVTSNAVFKVIKDFAIKSWTVYCKFNEKTYIHPDIVTSGAKNAKWIKLFIGLHSSYGELTRVSEYLVRLNYSPYQNTDYRGLKVVYEKGVNANTNGDYNILQDLNISIDWDENGIYVNNTNNWAELLVTVMSVYNGFQ